MWHANCSFFKTGVRQLNQITKILDDAIAAHEDENFLKAADLYLEILKNNSNHPDANHNLGLLSVHTGKAREGLLFFENAINSNPTVPTYWVSLLNTLISLKEFQVARDILKQANAMGHKSKSFKEIEHVLEAPEFSDSTEISEYYLKKLHGFLQKRNFKDFKIASQKYSKKYPNSIKLKEAQAQAFYLMKKNDLLILKLKEILAINPNSFKNLEKLGSIYLKMKEYEQAISVLLMAVKLDPNNPTIHYNLGVAYSAIHKFRDSIIFYEKSISYDPKNEEVLINLANAYAEVGKIDKAISLLRKSIDVAPKRFESHFNLAHYLSSSGKYSEAKEYFLRTLEIYPDHPLTHHALSSLIDYSKDTEHLKNMEKIISSDCLETNSAALINFSIAKAYDQLGDSEKAYNHYKTANLLQNKITEYCTNKEKKFFNSLVNLGYMIKNQAHIKIPQKSNLVPIFIVGMPRSGTSLIEQILTAHSKISGAGELRSLSDFGSLIIDKALNTSQHQLELFRDHYIQEISEYADEKANFVTDKLPHNFRFIPLIKLLFPESKVIHIKRDPCATCWSNYARYFSKGSLKYSYDMTNLVDYYLMYEDLMQEWSKNFQNSFYTVNYEKLVSDYNTEIPKLLEYIGTNFETNCIQPHKNKRLVKTSSNKQVRQKIYTGSSSVWKKYQPFLKGAFNRLKN